VLAFRVFQRLSFGRRTSAWAVGLFAIASVTVEPVVWPAARFDLLATAFILAALGSSLDYLRDSQGGRARLAAAVVFTSVGILSKEIAYSVPIIVIFLIATAPVWELGRPGLRRMVRLVAAVSVPCLLGVAVRLALYGGLGGYPGQSRPMWLPSFKSVVSLVIRVLPVPPLGLNSSIPLGFPGIAALVLFAAGCVLIALLSSRPLDRKAYAIAGLALASALPVVNVAGWLGPSMLHSRYLYWPAVWTALLLVHIVETCRAPRLVLAILLLANVLATTSNLLAYRGAMTSAERVAARVGRDIRRRPNARAVYLAGIPGSGYGVLFFADHMLALVNKEAGGRPVSLVPAAARDPLPPDLIYRWDSRLRDVR
jgi:putative flippase GtrA